MDDSRGNRSWWSRRSDGEKNAIILGIFGVIAALVAGILTLSLSGDEGEALIPNPGPDITVSDSPPATSTPGMGIIQTPPGKTVKVYAEPSLTSAVISELAAGTRVTISCTLHGQLVEEYGMSSDLWNKIGDGFVSDIAVYTGSQYPVAPSCLDS